MRVFSKTDMAFSYRWELRPTDDPNYRKGPSHRLFHRMEGYHVLFVVNGFLEVEGFKLLASAKKAERLIRERLPKKEFAHEELYEWLAEVW